MSCLVGICIIIIFYELLSWYLYYKNKQKKKKPLFEQIWKYQPIVLNNVVNYFDVFVRPFFHA